MPFYIYLLLLIISCLGLAKATSLIVKSIDRLADLSHIPRLGLASFLLAFATSLPASPVFYSPLLPLFLNYLSLSLPPSPMIKS
jgi:Ca2+/Na+ antiporter